jgi:hypothetical protein
MSIYSVTYTPEQLEQYWRPTQYEIGDILFNRGVFGYGAVMIVDKVLKYSMMEQTMIPFYVMHIFRVDIRDEVAHNAVDGWATWKQLA